MRTLVVTNDFPPILGGIETFVHALATRLPGDVTVLTRAVPGGDAADATLPCSVRRVPMSPLLPGPRLAAWVAQTVRDTRANAVWFASAGPLALLAGAARRAGASTVVASTHGHETWWAAMPVTRQALRRIATSVDALTYVSEFTRERIARALPAAAGSRLVRLSPGVDTAVFRPDPLARAEIRRRLGLADRPVVLSLARLVTRKGHDRLLQAWPAVSAAHPDAALVVVGEGPRRPAVTAAVQRLGGAASGVHAVGGVPWVEASDWYAAGDVFAVPTRTRLAGLEAEAFGICYLEAAAAGLAVVAGRSGGTPEVVLDGVTGVLVDGRSSTEVAAALNGLLASPERAARLGAAGRAAVARRWSWDASAARLTALLSGEPAAVGGGD